MVMQFIPGHPTITPMRDDLRRRALVSDPLKTYINNMSSLVAHWPLDDTGGVVSRVVNSAFAEGCNLAVAGDMSDVTKWAIGNSASLSIASGRLQIRRNGVNNPYADQQLFRIGRLYHITGLCRSLEGTAIPAVSGGSLYWQGTTSTSDQQIGGSAAGLYIVANASASLDLAALTTSGTTGVEFGPISITELLISASSDFPTLELVKNGGFDWDVAWVKAAGATISGGLLRFTAVASGNTANTASNTPLIIGRSYDVTYTALNYSSGSFRILCGGGGVGTTRSANGTFTETIVCATNTVLSIQAIGGGTTTCDFDNVSVVPHDGLIVWDGVSTAANWTVVASATITNPSAGVLRVAYNGVTAPRARQSVLKSGSTYRLIVTATPSGASIRVFAMQNSTTILDQTISTATGFDLIFVATGATFDLGLATGAAGQYVDWSVFSLTEIAPMSGIPLNGVLMNQSSGNPLLDPVYLFDGVNDVVQIGSAPFNSAFNPQSFTVIVPFWYLSGSAQQTVFSLRADDSNRIQFDINVTGNMRFLVNMGVSSTTLTRAFSDAAHPHVAGITYDGTKLRFYFDGVLLSETAYSGVWVGNLSLATSTYGASNTSGNNRLSGYGFDPAVFNAPLEPDVMMTIAQLAGVA